MIIGLTNCANFLIIYIFVRNNVFFEYHLKKINICLTLNMLLKQKWNELRTNILPKD